MKYAHLNYNDPSIEIVETALFITKNLEFTDLSPSEQRTVKRNASAVLSKLEAKSDKITLSNIATMYYAVGNTRLMLKDNNELYRELFPAPELTLPSYLKALEASAKDLESLALELGFHICPIPLN